MLKLDLKKDFAEVLRQRLAAAGYPPIPGEGDEDAITRYVNVLNRTRSTASLYSRISNGQTNS